MTWHLQFVIVFCVDAPNTPRIRAVSGTRKNCRNFWCCIPPAYNTKATDLLSLEGTVNGILAESDDTYYTIHSKAVILATGGFGNNQEMIVRYREDLEGTVTTSAPRIMGDGIVMAQAVGADLVDVDQIQLHPTVEQKTSMLITESVRGGNRLGGNAVADIVVFGRSSSASAVEWCNGLSGTEAAPEKEAAEEPAEEEAPAEEETVPDVA